ncbi:MAG: insulinase family protein [Verrucomicrobia bacterium]|nr:insulinase family protein [Verrucomicrobiota bacterium]
MPHSLRPAPWFRAAQVAAFVSALCAVTALSPAADVPKKIATVEGITEYQLDNGLRLLLYPDQSQSRVSVNMTVLVGSRHEGYGETGMAHLLEHLVFKGTPRHPLVPKALQEHGAVFNGSTNDDRTNYYETLAATDENLEFAIDLEADRLVNSFVRRDDLLSEMTVVRNEFERGENSASRVLSQRISAVAYEWHNYGKSTIGNRSDIERVPIENLRAFYQKFYQPDNVVLVLAGKFDEAKALGFVQKHFGAIPRPARKLPATWTEEPVQDGERTVTLRRVGVNSAVGLAYHIPAGPHEDTAALQVLASALNARPSGRLYKALIESKKATSAAAFSSRQHDPSLFMASADVARDGSVDEVRDVLLATIEGAGATDFSAEEVNRAKQQILKQRELSATDTAQIGISLSEWAAQGDWRLYFLYRDRIEQVTPEAVRTVAKRYFKQSNRTVGLFIPTDQPDRAAIPATPDLKTLVAGYSGRAAIAEGEAFDPTPANIESRVSRSELPDGLKVTVLPKKSRGQEVHATLTLRYGNEQNLKDLEGAAGFLPDLMMQGTRKLTAQQLRDELDRLGATISSGAGGGGRRGGGRRGGGGGGGGGSLGSATFSIQAKRDTLPAVLDLLGQVLREPLLPAEQFEISKRARLAALEEMRTEPAMLGPRLLQRTLNPYPKDDIRYQPTIEESLERLQAVTHSQVTRLHRDYLGGATGELTIVGDFDPDAGLMIAKTALADWKPKQAYARIGNPPPAAVPGSRHVINTPDKANATYSAGLNLAMRDDDPDYPALVIGNYLIGAGTLASRLGVRIRQQEGLSYGVSSSFTTSSQDKRATFSITAICNPQNMPRLEVCVQEELARLLKDGITAEELAKARQGYLESRKVSRSSDAAINDSLAGYRYVGRTMTWQSDFEKKIAALTPESVNAALRKHLDPQRLVIVVAGDFEAAGKPAGAK